MQKVKDAIDINFEVGESADTWEGASASQRVKHSELMITRKPVVQRFPLSGTRAGHVGWAAQIVRGHDSDRMCKEHGAVVWICGVEQRCGAVAVRPVLSSNTVYRQTFIKVILHEVERDEPGLVYEITRIGVNV